MADITDKKRSTPVQIVGGGTDDEEYISSITPLKETSTSDILNNSWTTGTIIVGTTAIELKVGLTIKENRKNVFFQLLDSGRIYWGFSNSDTPFVSFKYQIISLTAGSETSIWIKANEAGKSVAVGEA